MLVELSEDEMQHVLTGLRGTRKFLLADRAEVKALLRRMEDRLRLWTAEEVLRAEADAAG